MEYLAKLSGNKCALTCATGYGNDTIVTPDICIKCSNFCTSCLDSAYYCISCVTNYFLYPNDPNITCVAVCPTHTFPNISVTPKFCQTCNDTCLNCTWNAFRCTSCYPGFYLYNWTCYNPCPLQTYANTNTTCAACFRLCYECDTISTNCTVCDLNGTNKAFLFTNNNTCVVTCGVGYFDDTNNGTGPNVCTPCDIACATCVLNSTYCFSCNPDYYLLNNVCGPTCPAPTYF
jgi:proprotein convertase subtilisin/kexin type 5